VKERKGIVIGVGVLVDRTEQKPDFGASFYGCVRAEAISYPADNCPLCAANIPIVKPGGS
ncbi:MAG TPA: orotate phosphoribosyltransferase, partial [Dehalococcoidales bacterium]|nr:orotate phosphoribosyltransferase [Dehalococcoidales bacterium]